MNYLEINEQIEQLKEQLEAIIKKAEENDKAETELNARLFKRLLELIEAINEEQRKINKKLKSHE